MTLGDVDAFLAKNLARLEVSYNNRVYVAVLHLRESRPVPILATGASLEEAILNVFSYLDD